MHQKMFVLPNNGGLSIRLCSLHAAYISHSPHLTKSLSRRIITLCKLIMVTKGCAVIKKRNDLDNVSVEELDQILRIRRRQARQERFVRLASEGATANAALLSSENPNTPIPTPLTPPPETLYQEPLGQLAYAGANAGVGNSHISGSLMPETTNKSVRDRLLLFVEIGALIGIMLVLVSSYFNLQALNTEVAEVQNASLLDQAGPERLDASSNLEVSQFAFDRLPGGHTPPTAPGGAVPEVPAHLQNWVQPPSPVPIPTQNTAQATRIVIPKINVDAPIIQGVTWEDLKKGVGHLPDSANPGERGNMYLAAHNDIYGEIFRYLEDLEPGDEYHVYAGEAKYTYVVREKRIIEPTEVSVMLPTTEPVATLQTCYPYLIDTHRLVVISDLVN